MRRHTRDHHDIIIGSTSPPPKRKKKVTVDNAVNAESMDTENVDINDLSLKLDEMEVDTPDSKNMNEESNLKDEKIREKERKNEEKEQLSKAGRKKIIAEEEELEQSKSMNKKRKNLLKLLRKKTNKKMRKNKSLRVETGISNIKSIPDNCKHLFQDGDVLYVVPGDGCCGPNCAAAFLFRDEVFGPQLRVLMNKFMAKHWYR